jgi:hypothetical protein
VGAPEESLQFARIKAARHLPGIECGRNHDLPPQILLALRSEPSRVWRCGPTKKLSLCRVELIWRPTASPPALENFSSQLGSAAKVETISPGFQENVREAGWR